MILKFLNGPQKGEDIQNQMAPPTFTVLTKDDEHGYRNLTYERVTINADEATYRLKDSGEREHPS